MIGNGTQEPKKRRGRPPKPKIAVPTEKPKLPPLDPFAAAKEAEAHAQEGNRKFCLAVDALRSGLELIVVAEMDNATGLPTTVLDLRKLAVETLNQYSAITGQSWRRAKLSGPTRAGDRSLKFEEN